MESLVSSRTGRQFQRYYDGCRQVVGCIPYRYKISNQSHLLQGSLIENLEVLLISSPKAHHLFFPKGGWEIDETMEEAAHRETKEEAGVVGILENQLGKWSFKSKSQGTLHDAYMFPLLVEEQLDVWPEKNARRRIWMRVKEAREICSHSWMKEALDVFVCRLLQGMRQKEEENRTTCALEFLRTEQQRIGIVPQNGDEEADCYLRVSRGIIYMVLLTNEKPQNTVLSQLHNNSFINIVTSYWLRMMHSQYPELIENDAVGCIFFTDLS